MQRSLATVWISAGAVRQINDDADEFYPLETGGLLFGYRVNNREFVVEKISSAGPNSLHYPFRYVPDYEHDERVAINLYRKSDSRLSYLGDWHSHPNTTTPYLSRKDKKALKQIAKSPDSGTESPLSIIAAGNLEGWNCRCWIGEIARVAFGFGFIVAFPTTINEFDA